MRKDRRRREANRRSIIDMLDTRPATVARPAAPSPAQDPLEDLDFDWRPQPLEKAVADDRSFRWPVIGAALVMAAAAIVLVRGLGTFSDAQANERLTLYRTAITEFEDALDTLEAALPAVDTATALSFETAIEHLRSTADEPLPGLPPFVPQGSLGDVSRAREHLQTMADVATSIAADLAVATRFTEAGSTLFAVPPLPFSAPEELIAPAGAAITTMESETRATLAGLEPDPTFATYLAAVESALDDLADWADRYLLALRRGDAETAESLLGIIDTEEQALLDELTIGLTTIAKGVDERISDLRAAIDRGRVLTASG